MKQLLPTAKILLFLLFISCGSDENMKNKPDEIDEIDFEVSSITPANGVEGDTVRIQLDQDISMIGLESISFNDRLAQIVEQGIDFLKIQIPAGSFTTQPNSELLFLYGGPLEEYKITASFQFKQLTIDNYSPSQLIRGFDSLITVTGTNFSKFSDLYNLKLSTESGSTSYPLDSYGENELIFNVKSFRNLYQEITTELLYQNEVVNTANDKAVFIDFFQLPENTFNDNFVPTSLILLEFPYGPAALANSELTIGGVESGILYEINGDNGVLWYAEIPSAVSLGDNAIELRCNGFILETDIESIEIVEGSFSLSANEIDEGDKVTITVSHFIQNQSFVVRLLDPINDRLIEEKEVNAVSTSSGVGIVGDFFPDSPAGLYKIEVILESSDNSFSYTLPPSELFPNLPFAGLSIN